MEDEVSVRDRAGRGEVLGVRRSQAFPLSTSLFAHSPSRHWSHDPAIVHWTHLGSFRLATSQMPVPDISELGDASAATKL